MYIVFLHYCTYDWFVQILFLTGSNMKVRGDLKKILVTGLPAFSHNQMIPKESSHVSEVCRVETGSKLNRWSNVAIYVMYCVMGPDLI